MRRVDGDGASAGIGPCVIRLLPGYFSSLFLGGLKIQIITAADQKKMPSQIRQLPVAQRPKGKRATIIAYRLYLVSFIRFPT